MRNSPQGHTKQADIQHQPTRELTTTTLYGSHIFIDSTKITTKQTNQPKRAQTTPPTPRQYNQDRKARNRNTNQTGSTQGGQADPHNRPDRTHQQPRATRPDTEPTNADHRSKHKKQSRESKKVPYTYISSPAENLGKPYLSIYTGVLSENSGETLSKCFV